MDPSTATYLYCVVHAAAAPKVSRAPRGLPGATRPSVLPLGRSLWLAVAQVPVELYGSEPLKRALGDMQWVAEVAIAHEAVVNYFARQADVTVVPMKLFTMFWTIPKAIDEMRARRRDLAPVVKRIAACEEWGVRLIRTGAPLQRGRAASPARSTSGAAFLAAKKKMRDDALAAVDALARTADDVYATLRGIARDARRREGAPEGVTPPVLDAAFLVPSARLAEFRSAAKRLSAASARAGASMTLSGPWPAYNFVNGSGR